MSGPLDEGGKVCHGLRGASPELDVRSRKLVWPDEKQYSLFSTNDRLGLVVLGGGGSGNSVHVLVEMSKAHMSFS